MANESNGRSPMLKTLGDEIEKLSGNEPMLSGIIDMKRMGRTQVAFLEFLRNKWFVVDDITMLAAWTWVDDWTGNINASKRMRDEARRWTSARLAGLIHSFVRRGLIVIVKHEDGWNYIRRRGSHDKVAFIREG